MTVALGLFERLVVALETLASGAAATPVTVGGEPASTVEKVTKPRGRPAKGGDDTPKPEVKAAEAVAEVDPFEIDEPAAAPAKKLELTDVRAALVAYGKKVNSPEKARQKLKEFGGVDTLGVLPPEKFQAVFDAVTK